MYVCVTLRNAIYVAGRLLACTDYGPYVVHLTYYSGMENEDDEERSRRLAKLDTHGRLPTDVSKKAGLGLGKRSPGWRRPGDEANLYG